MFRKWESARWDSGSERAWRAHCGEEAARARLPIDVGTHVEIAPGGDRGWVEKIDGEVAVVGGVYDWVCRRQRPECVRVGLAQLRRA